MLGHSRVAEDDTTNAAETVDADLQMGVSVMRVTMRQGAGPKGL